MAVIFIDKDSEGGDMRQQMRRSMRSGYRYGGHTPYMHHSDEEYKRGYEMGYRHAWQDKEDDDEVEYRRRRDSRGRFV